MQGILYNLKAFVGTDYGHPVVFLICMCVCVFFARKREIYRSLTLTIGISLLFLFNPFFYKVVGEKFLSGVYWRLFWVIPIGLVVALMCTELAGLPKRRWIACMIVITLLPMLAVSGQLVLSRDNFSFPENPYQLSTAVIEVCDSILEDCDSELTLAIMPYEFLTEVRQYTSRIGLFYGRNVDGYITQLGLEEKWAYYMMSQSEVDIGTLRTLALGKNVEYIVFNDSFHYYPEDMEQYGYKLVESLDGYSIFKIIEE